MKKAAYRAGRIQVQGTLKIDVFSHIKYWETLARKRFWAVLWRLAKFSRLLAQPLCWNDKTRSFRNASSRSEIHFFCKKCDQALGCPSQTHFRTSTRNLRFSLKTWISIVFLHAKWINFSPKCEKVGSIRHLPCTKVSDSGTQWTHVSLRGRTWTNRPPRPISKTLVMVQSDPTRTPTQVLLIDVR